MKFFSKSVLASFAALTLTPLSALALPPDCDVKCTGTARCSSICAKPWSFEVLTCGEWLEDYGDIYGGSCNPNFSPTLEEEAASMAPDRDSADDSAWDCRETAQSASSSEEG
ncbi:hypothetical protein [Myxococcus qinghaiensis]|uniref:hypothetical protein n=1 Tax=Myxococcus qinghaiensis TaxID=2906758 RepID=UPI0020A8219B|nr:hypothetical protein [Myxococcus qinghaiensis]MCP3162530.1 hypothetical protein [Myxococcus qinghaiensis]